MLFLGSWSDIWSAENQGIEMLFTRGPRIEIFPPVRVYLHQYARTPGGETGGFEFRKLGLDPSDPPKTVRLGGETSSTQIFPMTRRTLVRGRELERVTLSYLVLGHMEPSFLG